MKSRNSKARALPPAQRMLCNKGRLSDLLISLVVLVASCLGRSNGRKEDTGGLQGCRRVLEGPKGQFSIPMAGELPGGKGEGWEAGKETRSTPKP